MALPLRINSLIPSSVQLPMETASPSWTGVVNRQLKVQRSGIVWQGGGTLTGNPSLSIVRIIIFPSDLVEFRVGGWILRVY